MVGRGGVLSSVKNWGNLEKGKQMGKEKCEMRQVERREWQQVQTNSLCGQYCACCVCLLRQAARDIPLPSKAIGHEESYLILSASLSRLPFLPKFPAPRVLINTAATFINKWFNISRERNGDAKKLGEIGFFGRIWKEKFSRTTGGHRTILAHVTVTFLLAPLLYRCVV